METRTIKIDGEMKKVEVYETIFEYLNNATFLDQDFEYILDNSKYIIDEFDIDNFLQECSGISFIRNEKDESEYFTIDGKEYIYINWGENEISLVPYEPYYGYGYIIYENVGNDGICSDDEYKFVPYKEYIYETEEEAQVVIDKLNGDN